MFLLSRFRLSEAGIVCRNLQHPVHVQAGLVFRLIFADKVAHFTPRTCGAVPFSPSQQLYRTGKTQYILPVVVQKAPKYIISFSSVLRGKVPAQPPHLRRAAGSVVVLSLTRAGIMVSDEVISSLF